MAGGLVGEVSAGTDGDLSLASVRVNAVTGVGTNVGGLFGGGFAFRRVDSSFVRAGEITGSDRVGGLFGDFILASNTKIAATLVVANRIIASGSSVGGFVGRAPDSPNSIDSSMAVVGVISGTNQVGGLQGDFPGATPVTEITDSLALIGVIRASGSDIGALTGRAIGTVTATYHNVSIYSNNTATIFSGENRTYEELQNPTSFTGDYADWADAWCNPATGEFTTNASSALATTANRAWNLGGPSDFPALNCLGSIVSLDEQRQEMMVLDDLDGDGIPNDIDPVPDSTLSDLALGSPDGDQLFGTEDNCPTIRSNNNEDYDEDGKGNICDDFLDGSKWKAIGLDSSSAPEIVPYVDSAHVNASTVNVGGAPGFQAAQHILTLNEYDPMGGAIRPNTPTFYITTRPRGHPNVGLDKHYYHAAVSGSTTGEWLFIDGSVGGGDVIDNDMLTQPTGVCSVRGQCDYRIKPDTDYILSMRTVWTREGESYPDPGTDIVRLFGQASEPVGFARTRPVRLAFKTNPVPDVSSKTPTGQTATLDASGTSATIGWTTPEILTDADFIAESEVFAQNHNLPEKYIGDAYRLNRIIVNSTRVVGGVDMDETTIATDDNPVFGSDITRSATNLLRYTNYKFKIYAEYIETVSGTNQIVYSNAAETGVIRIHGPVDTDNDGLIEIRTADELHAIRNSLDGSSLTFSGGVGITAGCPTVTSPGTDADGNPITSCIGYELINDIDLASINPWAPIGSCTDASTCVDTDAFSAIFEGNGHTISNININVTGNSAGWGLFGYVAGAVGSDAALRNLVLTNVTLDHTALTMLGETSYAGSLVGFAKNTDITDVAVNIPGNLGFTPIFITGIDSTTEESILTFGKERPNINVVGGLVGRFESDSGNNVVRHSIVEGGEIGGSADVGGLVGHLITGKIVSSATKLLSIAGINRTGGLVGTIESSSVHEASISSSLASTAANVWVTNHDGGGLVGRSNQDPAKDVIIRDSGAYSTGVGVVNAAGSVRNSYQAALVGRGDFTVERSLATASRFVSTNRDFSNASSIGGITGDPAASPDITDSYYRVGNVTSDSTSHTGGGIPPLERTLVEMHNPTKVRAGKSIFVNWGTASCDPNTGEYSTASPHPAGYVAVWDQGTALQMPTIRCFGSRFTQIQQDARFGLTLTFWGALGTGRQLNTDIDDIDIVACRRGPTNATGCTVGTLTP